MRNPDVIFRSKKIDPAWLKFGMVIEAARLEYGVDLYDLAKLLGFSREYLSDIEQGQIGPPTDDKVVQLAQYLAIDHMELIDLAYFTRTKQEKKEDLSIKHWNIPKHGYARFKR